MSYLVNFGSFQTEPTAILCTEIMEKAGYKAVILERDRAYFVLLREAFSDVKQAENVQIELRKRGLECTINEVHI